MIGVHCLVWVYRQIYPNLILGAFDKLPWVDPSLPPAGPGYIRIALTSFQGLTQVSSQCPVCGMGHLGLARGAWHHHERVSDRSISSCQERTQWCSIASSISQNGLWNICSHLAGLPSQWYDESVMSEHGATLLLFLPPSAPESLPISYSSTRIFPSLDQLDRTSAVRHHDANIGTLRRTTETQPSHWANQKFHPCKWRCLQYHHGGEFEDNF